MKNIHASSIVYNNKGLLFLGQSGTGKSDICLRLIMQKNATLIADDRTDISVVDNNIYATCPKQIEGLLEARGIGIKKFNFVAHHPIDLVIELVDSYSKVERMPQPDFFEFEGVKIPKIKLYAFGASSLEKLAAWFI